MFAQFYFTHISEHNQFTQIIQNIFLSFFNHGDPEKYAVSFEPRFSFFVVSESAPRLHQSISRDIHTQFCLFVCSGHRLYSLRINKPPQTLIADEQSGGPPTGWAVPCRNCRDRQTGSLQKRPLAETAARWRCVLLIKNPTIHNSVSFVVAFIFGFIRKPL